MLYFLFATLDKLLNNQSSCQWYELPWGSWDITAIMFCNQQVHHCKFYSQTYRYRNMIIPVPVDIPAPNITIIYGRVDSRLTPSQWKTSLQSSVVSHWVSANLKWALYVICSHCADHKDMYHSNVPCLPILYFVVQLLISKMVFHYTKLV